MTSEAYVESLGTTEAYSERLGEELIALKAFIAELPHGCGRSDEALVRAKHTKIFEEKKNEYEMILEKDRVASVACQHEELHPPKTERCPICLEDIHVANPVAWITYACCGNGCCSTCGRGSITSCPLCPLCRAMFPRTEEANNALVMQRANDGRSWAQTNLGHWYRDGANGLEMNKREGLKWLELAAAQNDAAALYDLSEMYKEGYPGIVKKSESKAMELLKESADLGFSMAQFFLAERYMLSDNPAEQLLAVYYMTLAVASVGKYYDGTNSQGHIGDTNRPTNIEDFVDFGMGALFWFGHGGLKKSLHRAVHYLRRAAMQGVVQAYRPLASTLYDLGASCYENNFLPGHDCRPEALFWARKAVECDADDESIALSLIKSWEKHLSSSCANCMKKQEDLNEPLKKCIRCKAAWYCSKECQIKHWNDGHKVDCIKKR